MKVIAPLILCGKIICTLHETEGVCCTRMVCSINWYFRWTEPIKMSVHSFSCWPSSPVYFFSYDQNWNVGEVVTAQCRRLSPTWCGICCGCRFMVFPVQLLIRSIIFPLFGLVVTVDLLLIFFHRPNKKAQK